MVHTLKPQTGVPLGTLMIDKKMYTGPVYDRVALGIFDEGEKNRFDVARVQLDASLKGSEQLLRLIILISPECFLHTL